MEAQRRLKICHNCAIITKNKKRCSLKKGGCGCFVDLKVYCTEEDCKCPKGKW